MSLFLGLPSSLRRHEASGTSLGPHRGFWVPPRATLSVDLSRPWTTVSSTSSVVSALLRLVGTGGDPRRNVHLFSSPSSVPAHPRGMGPFTKMGVLTQKKVFLSPWGDFGQVPGGTVVCARAPEKHIPSLGSLPLVLCNFPEVHVVMSDP